jgi:hypothetical protein
VCVCVLFLFISLKIDPRCGFASFKKVALFPHRRNVVDVLLAWDDQLQSARMDQMTEQVMAVGDLLRTCDKFNALWSGVQLSPGDVLIAYVYAVRCGGGGGGGVFCLCCEWYFVRQVGESQVSSVKCRSCLRACESMSE